MAALQLNFNFTQLVQRLWFPRSARRRSYLFELPNELIYHIAGLVEHPELVALASTCHPLRRIVAPLLFSKVCLESLDDLYCIAMQSEYLLGHARSLKIRANSQLLDALTDPCAKSTQRWDIPAFRYIATILCKAPKLALFAVVVGDRRPCARDVVPAWESYARYHGSGIKFGPPLAFALDRMGGSSGQGFIPGRYHDVRWPSIEQVYLEGMTDVSELLIRCPNITNLAIKVPDGWCANTTSEFTRLLNALETLPKLRRLELSPPTPLMTFALARDEGLPEKHSPRVIQMIAGCCGTSLETLDLTPYIVREESFSFALGTGGFILDSNEEDLADALSPFDQLTHLTLPYVLSPAPYEDLGGLNPRGDDADPVPQLAYEIAKAAPKLKQLRWMQPESPRTRYFNPFNVKEFAIKRHPDIEASTPTLSVKVNRLCPTLAYSHGFQSLDIGWNNPPPALRGMVLRLFGLENLSRLSGLLSIR